MGVEAHHPEDERVLTLLEDSGSQIVRYGSVLWYRVEPQPGEYDWSALTKMEQALETMAARGLDVILIVRGTPLWAQKVYGAACGPISAEHFQAFANFMAALVQRYSVPPYNVKYWEIGNEPDVDPKLVPADSGFGCWGDDQDVFYGGGYYAEMLKVVYPAMKAANPEAQILNGGLLLDCDPDNPPEGASCQPARFFEGMVASGGLDYLDYVNFHGYPPYFEQSLLWERELPGWAKRGGVVVGKINFLREVMQRYGAEKPLFLTETSLICPEWNRTDCNPPSDQFYETQADYLVRLFVRNWALNLAGTIWYDFEGRGWRYGGLVGQDASNPKQAFQAFRYLNQKLQGLGYVGAAPLPEALEGYIFLGAGAETWVVWSRDESPQVMDIPANVIVLDKYGQPIQLSGEPLTITSPVYFEFAP